MARDATSGPARIVVLCLALAAAASAALAAGGLDAHAQQGSLVVTAAGQLKDTPTLELDGAFSVDTFVIGANTYAAVASITDDGIQIIDITNPDSPAAAGQLADAGSLLLYDAQSLAVFGIGGNTYAAVTSDRDNGIQIIDITNPGSPAAAGQLADTEGQNELLLDNGRDVDTFVIGTNTYAVVASWGNNGIQIIDITNPGSPAAAGQLADAGSLLLYGAQRLAIFGVDGNTYAAVTSTRDGGIQIIDITNPDSPAAAGQLADNGDLLLGSSVEVKTFVMETRTYAAVTSLADSGLQIVDVTDPDNPVAAGKLPDNGDLLLDSTYGLDIVQIGERTYAVVGGIGGLQIVDVTDPDNPVAAGKLPDDDSLLLNDPRDVDTVMIGNDVFVVTTSASDDGFQVVRLSTVDTTKPVITLNGPPNVTLELGDTYNEQGASVSDNDPDYATTAATVGGDAVDTGTAGVYTVTYTAPADAAGNVPDPVSRTVTVRDTTPRPACAPPASGHWDIRDSCMLESDARAPAGITVHAPATLVIPAGITLDVDLANHGLLIKQGAGLLMESGGGMR